MAKLSKDIREFQQVSKMEIPFELVESLKKVKDMPEWKSLKALMKIIVASRKDIAFHLDEKDPTLFAIAHAKESAYPAAYNRIIDIIDKELRRESEI